ncbi:MAG: molecular chaperone DnaJ [Candidatus Krumholzibacteriia bacterium]|nr:molecular chaperone DnaJ [Candidatus Latescibacterota bacterium]
MAQRDYYEVLGVPKDADETAIRKAYRKLAMQYHPDRNPDDKSAEDKFKEATEAYEVLKDARKRQAYDQFGHAGVSGQGMGGGGPFGGQGIDMEEALRSFMRDFGFESFFGGGGGPGRARGAGADRGGRDLRVRVRLTLEEAAQGVEKQIKIKKKVTCSTCSGSGQRPGSRMQRCAECQGSGEIRRVQRSILGQFVNVSVCPRCHGEGSVIGDPCADCHGEGRVDGGDTVQVSIPPGVSTGDYIPLRGKGEAGLRGGPAGDVIVMLEVAEHALFQRVRQDLFLELPVTYSTLVLGGKVEVPTLDGAAKLTVPPGTQSHQLMRLRDKGLPHLNSRRRGDLIVRLVCWTPGRTGRDEQKLLQELETLEAGKLPGPRRPS